MARIAGTESTAKTMSASATFIVFSANAFALLGLRALFFLVAGASLVGERRASATPDARRPESAG